MATPRRVDADSLVVVALNRASDLICFIEGVKPSTTVREARRLFEDQHPDLRPPSYRVYVEGLGPVAPRQEGMGLLALVTLGAGADHRVPLMVVQDTAFVKRQREFREARGGPDRKRRRLLVVGEEWHEAQLLHARAQLCAEGRVARAARARASLRLELVERLGPLCLTRTMHPVPQVGVHLQAGVANGEEVLLDGVEVGVVCSIA